MDKRPVAKDVLGPGQRDLLGAFFEIPDSSYFYLTGGTALSEYYIGHRKSYDLDFFTCQDNLVLPFSRKVEADLRADISLKVIRRLNSFAEFEAALGDEKVKIQLGYDSPFRFSEPVGVGKVIVNDYADLVVDKLLAFYGRAEARDAVDLYFILVEQSIDFWELARLAKEKDKGFDLYWMARALSITKELPDQIGKWPVDMAKPFKVKDLKELFRGLAQEIVVKIRASDF